jgi:hypothetical protein
LPCPREFYPYSPLHQRSAPLTTHSNTYECTYGSSSLLWDVRRARKFEIRFTPTEGLNVYDNGLCLCAMCVCCTVLTCEECMFLITEGSLRGNVCACSACTCILPL